MRLCNNAVLAILVFATAASLTAQQPATPPGGGTSAAAQTQQTPQNDPSLTVDRDPVRSPDAEPPSTEVGPIRKEGPQGYTLHTEVDEVVLNCTVLDGNRLVPDLKKEDFSILEDGVKQTLISFRHTDLPVSIAIVVDNSGSMSRKRPAVNKSALDLIQASNPQDDAFVVTLLLTRPLLTRNSPPT